MNLLQRPQDIRIIAASVAAVGLVIGVSFGFGVACGHGDPKVVQSGVTTQQLQSLGINPAQLAGGSGAAGAAGAGGAGGGFGALAALTTGQVTAVDGQTVTVQTAQGEVKLNLGASTTVTTTTTGKAADLKAGMNVVASGTKNSDNTVDASAVSQVPPNLQGILGAGGRTASGSATPGGTPGARRTGPAGTAAP